MSGEAPESGEGQPSSGAPGTVHSPAGGVDAPAAHPPGHAHGHHPGIQLRFFEELKHRNIVRVGILYLLICWLILDPVHVVFNMLEVPAWTNRLVVILMAIGFPAVLLFAWVYEITPEGLKPTVAVEPSRSIRRQTGQRLNRAIIVVLSLALAYFVTDKFWLSKRGDERKSVMAATLASPAGNPVALAVSEQSVAVLPFVDLSEKKDQEYFSEGLSEELINLLSKVPALRVPARTSSFYFKDRSEDIPTIARRLMVAHVLEGSVRKAGNHLRITAQLVRADNGYHLWSQTYDRQLNDVFRVQDDIASAVVEQLKVTLLGAAPKAKATDPKAYDLFLQGRQLFRQKTPEGYTQAITLYEQALAIDPSYAAAWSGLSGVYINQITEGLRPVTGGCRLSREAANKALLLDPDMASALAQLGWIAMNCDDNLAAAAQRIARALTLAPEDSDVLHNATILAWGLGRLDTAIAIGEAEVARDPVNGLVYDSLGDSYCSAGRWDACLASYRTALALNPGYIGGHSSISYPLMRKGEPEAALAEAQQETAERLRLNDLPWIYAALGRKAESDAALADFIKKYEKQWPYGIALVLGTFGETDRAFDFLDKAAAGHEPLLFQIVVQQAFSSLHGDPRWLPFLRRIGRAPEQLAAISFDVKLPK